MDQKIYPTDQKIYPAEQNPNNDPFKWIKKVKEFKDKKDAVIRVIQDVSGSQGFYDRERVMRIIFKLLIHLANVVFYPFGFPVKERVWKSVHGDIINNYYGSFTPKDFYELVEAKGFNTATNTALIENYFKVHLNEDIPTHLVFQMDGDFSESEKTFLRILEENVHRMGNIKTLVLLFSPHTNPRDKEKLETEVTALLAKVGSFITLHVEVLRRDNPRRMCEILESLPKRCTVVPKGWLGWKNLLFHEDLTASSIARVLKNKYSKLIPLIIKDLLETIRQKPSLLLVGGNVYAKLHGALKILVKDFKMIQSSYFDKVATIKSRLDKTSSQYRAMETLMTMSVSDPAEIKWVRFQLRKLQVGVLNVDLCI